MLWRSFQLLIPFLVLSLQVQLSCCTSYGVDHATHTHQDGTLETQSAHSAAITTEEFRKYLNARQLDILMSLPRDYLLTVLAKQHVQLAHAHKTREELAHDTVVGAILDSAMQRSRAFHEHAKQIFILDDAKRRTEIFNSLKTTQSELRPKIESLGAGANKSSIGLEATKRYVCEDTDLCPVFILQKLHKLRHLEWAYYRSRFVSELALFTVEDLSSILKYVKEHNPLRGKTLNLTEAFTTFITELDKNELKLGSPETIFRDTNPNSLDSVHVFDTAGDIRCMEKDLQRAIELKKQHGSESFFQTLQHAFFSTHITERVRLKDAMNTLRVLLGLNYGEALLSDSSFVRQVQEHIRSMYREMSFNASGNDEFNIFSLFRKPHSIVATFRHHFLKLHHRIADQLLELYSTFTPESKKINDIAHNPFARASTSRLALYNCLDLSRQDEDLTFLKSVDTSSESVTEGSSIWGGKCSDLLDGALRTEGVALLALSVTTSASLPLKAELYASLELRNFRHTVLEQLFYGLSYSELSGERTSEYNALAEWYVHKISVLNTLRNSLLLPDLEADVPKPLPFSSSTLRFHFDRHLYEARRLLSLSRMDFESMDAKAGALQWQMREAERTLLKKAEEMNFTSVRKLSENLSFAEEFYHSAIQPLYFFHDQGATQDAEVLERANEARIALDTLELSDEGLAPLANEESLRIRAAALRQVFSTMKDVHLLHHTENLNVLTLTLFDFVQVMERYTPSQFVRDEGLLNQIMVSTCNFVPFVLHQDGVNPIPNRDADIHHCPSTVVSHFKSVRRSALDQARYHFLSMASRLDDVQLPALIQHVREKLRQREVPVEDVYAFPVIQELRRLVADVHLLYTLEHRLEKLHDVPGSTEVGALVQQLQTSDVFTDEEMHHPMTIKRVAKKIQEAQKRYSVLIEKIMASRLIFRDGTVEQGGAQVEVLSRRLLDQGVALTVMHRDLCLIQLHRDEHQMRLMHDYITSMRFVKRRNTLLQRTQLGFLLGNNFYDDSSDTGKIYQLVRKLIHLEGSMVHIKALRYRLAGRKIPRSEELALAVDDLRKEIDHYHVQVATALENRIKSEHFFSPKDWTDDDPRSALPFAMRVSQQESNNCYEEHEHAECSYIVEDHRHIVSWLWSTIQRDPPSLDILHDPILYLLYDMVTVMYVEEVAQNARGAGNYNLKVLLDRITELLNHVLRQLGIQESSQALEQTAEKTFSQDTIEQRVLSKGTEEHVDLPSTTLDLKGVDESIPDEMKNNVENYDDGALRSEARRLHDHAQEESSTRAGMPSEESPESMASSNSKPPAAHKSSVAATEEGVLPPNEVETSSSLSSVEAVEALTIATEKEHEMEEALNQEMSISKFLSSKDKIVFIVGICLLVGAVVGAIIFGVAIYMLWHHRSHCSEVVRPEDEAPVTPSESNEFGKYNTSLN